MKLYYFHLDLKRFPEKAKKDITEVREISYVKAKEYNLPVVVVKDDNNIVEDVITHDAYSLKENDNMITGYLIREINYEEYASLLNIVSSCDKNKYIKTLNNLHNILIEKENLKEEHKKRSIKGRLLIM